MRASFSDATLSPLNGAFVHGHSCAIQSLHSVIEEVARTNIPLLLMGESGSGKEVYGRMIHRLSQHAHKALKKVSCRAAEQAEFLALKSDLRQSAENSVEGLGTLFLDGIDELDLESQKILLSLLPDGETDENHLNHMRLIGSTSRNLEIEIETGKFRRELYFRINGVCLKLPPLRDRKEDIPDFMHYFLEKHANELEREAPVLNNEEMEFLLRHNWPGNVRELENLARRIVALGDSGKAIRELREMPRLDPAQREEPGIFPLKMAARTASRRAERDLIAKALQLTHWNRKRAAQQLQISYKSLLYKIKQTGLEEK